MITLRPILWQTIFKTGRKGVILAALLSTLTLPSRAADISYVYDDLGRLLAVIDPATDTAVYAYDAVGNLTGITRHASSTLAIFQFTPSAGPVGTNVTLYGTGFSATPASNTVKFNGTTATVLTATTTVLTTTVPSGATTGAISVTVAGNTVTSATNFTVGSPGGPTISGFSPTVGTAGTAVTINGTNYDTTSTKNKVTFSPAYGVVNTASAASMGVTVPVGAQSGKIGVTTVNGSVLSGDDFFVTPGGVNPADVQFTGRIVVGGSTVTATISTANKVALVVFDGVAGQRVNLGMTGVTIASSAISMFKPDGIVLATANYGSGGGALDSPVLPMTGTYTLTVNPSGANTGNMTITLSSEVTGSVTINDPATPVTLGRAGQNGRYTFSGTASQQVTVRITSNTLGNTTVNLYTPSGSYQTGTTNAAASFNLSTVTLGSTGTYTITVNPTTTATGSLNLQVTNP